MLTSQPDLSLPGSVTRRTLTRGVAWATPVIVVGAAASAHAASPGPPEPGLQGWVRVTKNCRNNNDDMDLTIDGHVDGTRYPVPPGYGLYVFNTSGTTVLTNAKSTFYYPSSLGTISWAAGGNNGNWSVPSVDPSVPAISGYTAYSTTYSGSWTYHGPPENPTYTIANTVPHFTATVTPGRRMCGDGGLSLYARRAVTVDGTEVAFVRGPVAL